MKTFIVFACLFLLFRADVASATNFGTLDQAQRNIGRIRGPEFEVLKVKCTKDESCIAFVYCDSKLFNERDMERIGMKLSRRFGNKRVINANLFDDKEIAEAYIKGVRGLGGIQVERRGWYLRFDDREFILFSPDPTNRDSQTAIKLPIPK